jgi:hypothetical protein
MSGLFELGEQLQGLNQTLGSKQRERADRLSLRVGLETYVGPLIRAKKMEPARTRELFQGRPLVGVDGSVNQFGGNYPYAVHLFKALAKSTMKNRAGEQAVEEVALLSPLRGEDHRRIREFVEERRDEIRVARQDEQEAEREIAESQAYGMLCDQRMVEMELAVAIQALEKFDPSLMMMDGGFSRLKGKGGELWKQLETLCEERDTLLVGVIEEVGSYRLKSRLDANPQLLEGFVRGHDREVLFGTLDEGEWLRTSLERPIKNDFYTVFTRLSDAPQAGACDFLRSQADKVDDVIDFLYTITPEKSRGIPLWLDLVDAEVRLTKKQVDMIVKGNIDLAYIESFLRPQRERRDF